MKSPVRVFSVSYGLALVLVIASTALVYSIISQFNVLMIAAALAVAFYLSVSFWGAVVSRFDK